MSIKTRRLLSYSLRITHAYIGPRSNRTGRGLMCTCRPYRGSRSYRPYRPRNKLSAWQRMQAILVWLWTKGWIPGSASWERRVGVSYIFAYILQSCLTRGTRKHIIPTTYRTILRTTVEQVRAYFDTYVKAIRKLGASETLSDFDTCPIKILSSSV